MLIWIGIVDLTQYVEFVYYPVRKLDGDCVEPIKHGATADAAFFSVYGRKGAEEEAIADFSTLAEASGYCLILNMSMEGRVPTHTRQDEDSPETSREEKP
jgi:hypothetical protein